MRGCRDRWGELPSSLGGRAKARWLKLDLLTTLFTCNQRQVYQELIYWDLVSGPLPYIGSLQGPGKVSSYVFIRPWGFAKFEEF